MVWLLFRRRFAEQLYARYQYQRTALARQFPFMMGNDVWKGGGKLSPNDQVGLGDSRNHRCILPRGSCTSSKSEF